MYGVQDVAIAIRYDSHGHKEAPQQEEEDEGGVVGVLGGPVQRAAQLVDLQRVAVPAQQGRPGPCDGVQPDVGNGPPGPGEVNNLGVHHPNVPLVRQGGESHDGHDA